MMPITSFDIVIATRNRPDALALSIPLMLAEKRQPQNLIIIDSSDNHEEIKTLILKLTSAWKGSVVIEYEKQPSSSKQRNIGLQYVTADVVIFPDDDSIILPGAFDEMLRIYDLDTAHRIAGVCAAEEISAPEGLLQICSNAYALTFTDRVKKKLTKIRDLFERTLIPSATLIFGRQLIKAHQIPAWFVDENVVPVEFMSGFRMSFRAESIKKYKFIEIFSGYCLFEDIGASFQVLQDGLLVGARNAKIYHHKHTGKRGQSYTLGLLQILNMAYVLAVNLKRNRFKIIASFYLQSAYKLALYSLGVFTKDGRDRFIGAFRGFLMMGRLFLVPDRRRDELYRGEISRISGKSRIH